MEMPGNGIKRIKKAAADLLLALFGAHRLIGKSKIQILQLAGLEKDYIYKVLRRVRSAGDWKVIWESEGEKDLQQAQNEKDDISAKHLFKMATTKFFIAHVLLDAFDPERARLAHKIRSSYMAYGKLEGGRFEKITLNYAGNPIYGYFQHPRNHPAPPVVMIFPYLGGTKEDMTFFSDYLLSAGFATLRIDLPGTGESPGILPLDAEKICSGAIDYLFSREDIDKSKVISLGISMGAYWSMRTAAIDKRLRLAVGISTPAMTSKQWDNYPKDSWGWWQKCFGTADHRSTRDMAEKLSLWNIFNNIDCPILLFHGEKDTISHPKTVEMIISESKYEPNIRSYKKSGHGCLDMMMEDVMPFTLKWCGEKLSLPIKN